MNKYINIYISKQRQKKQIQKTYDDTRLKEGERNKGKGEQRTKRKREGKHNVKDKAQIGKKRK